MMSDEIVEVEGTEGVAKGVPQGEQIHAPAPDYSDRLRVAKLKAILKSYDKDLDVDDELDFVGGLSVDGDGEIIGKAKYRPKSRKVAPTPVPAAKPKDKVTTNIDEWVTQAFDRLGI